MEELESCKEALGIDSTTQNKPQDAIERTSGNYGPNKNGVTKKQSTNKRKVCETNQSGAESNKIRLRGTSADNVTVSVTVTQNDVAIEMRCPWRENVLLEIMEAVSGLHMVVQTVQSSDSDGILSLTIKAKVCSPNQRCHFSASDFKQAYNILKTF